MVRARSNRIGVRSCSTSAASATSIAEATSPVAASHIARQRAPAANIHERSSAAPLRSRAQMNGSASCRRSTTIIASAALGMYQPDMISVPGTTPKWLVNGSSVVKASACLPSDTSRKPLAIRGHSAMRGASHASAAVSAASASASVSASRPLCAKIDARIDSAMTSTAPLPSCSARSTASSAKVVAAAKFPLHISMSAR
jgi:hypothetical protein